jgi:hypothetical protein
MTESIVPNYVQIEADGLEFVVDTDQGLAYASESAIPRIIGMPRSTIQDALKGCRNQSVENAKVQTPGGMQGCRLYPASEVFKLAIKFNPDLALAMGEAGANLYMLNAAGYKVEVKEPHPTRIADPTTLGANFYAWDDRNTPKVKWYLDKQLKRYKGKCVWLLRDGISGLSFLDLFSVATSDRIYTLFAFDENVSAVVEMRQFLNDRLSAGAKPIT